MLFDNSLSDDEIIIEDGVYNIADFAQYHHPGGDIIKIFGRMDVTRHYRSIHHTHSKEYHKKVMNRFFVRKVANNDNVNFDTDFARDLKSRVVRGIPYQYANRWWYARATTYVSLWLVCMYTMVVAPSYLVAICYGVAKALMGTNIMHDASHGSISRSWFVNDLFFFLSTYPIGLNQFAWFQQHIMAHHPFTNDYDKDGDIKSGEPYLVTHPSGKIVWYHRFQAYFMEALFSFFTVLKVTSLDIVTMKLTDDFHVVTWLWNKRHLGRFMKTLYLFVNIVLPIYYHGVPVIRFYLLTTIVSSLILATIFIISHCFDGVKHHEQTNDWYRGQIATSSSYGGQIACWLTGGLNFQIEHHLFPRVNSCHYVKLHSIVVEVCRQHNIPYTYFPTIFDNFQSTITYMTKVGTGKYV